MGKPVSGLLARVSALAGRGKRLYIVGGILRDILLKREDDGLDIDFAVDRGAVELARKVARSLRSLRAGFVVLDAEHGTGRVVIPGPGRGVTLDFTDFRGRDIKEDLYHRDFGINSLACGLDDALSGKPLEKALIDPWGGVKDLRQRRVRAVNPAAFEEDPARILRAFSACAVFDFSLEPRTRRLAEDARAQLKRVSAERARDELFAIASSPRAGETFALLDKSGIIEILFPELEPMKRKRQGAYHHLDVWGHTLATCRALDGSLRRLRASEPVAYLGEELSSGRNRGELLKLAALLHDIGKPKTYRRVRGKITFYGHDREGARICQSIAERLKLSREEQRMLRKVVFMHLRPGFMATVPVLSARAEFRFFRDAGAEAPAILLLSAADLAATRGYALADRTRSRHERLIRRLLKKYFQRREQPAFKRLVTGDDLIKRLKMEPSPLVGKVLRELEELQAGGVITTKTQGLSRAREIIKRG